MSPPKIHGSASVNALLQRALHALQNNDFATVESTLSGLLASDPENFNALQLMGVMCRTQRREQEAEDFYRRSLKSNPNQPHVYHNLGNLLRSNGRIAEAVEAQREALAQKPDYVEALLSLALALSDMGDNASAETYLQRILNIEPRHALAKQTLGAVLNSLNRPKEAETLLKSALGGRIDERQAAALEHNLALSVMRQNRHDEALALFDSARAKVPNMRFVDYNRGNALQHLGQLEAAVDSYRNAIKINPLDMLAHRDLNHLLYRLGGEDQYLRSYDDVMAMWPDIGEVPLAKASFLLQGDDYQNALENFSRAAKLLPQNAEPFDGLGRTHARLGDFDAAIHAHKRAVDLEPRNAAAWRSFAETFLRAGDANKALAAAETGLAIDPENQGALAMWSIAARLLNDGRDEKINDYDNLVQTFDIEPPDGYPDIETFNRDLNDYLDRLHRDKRQMLVQTLRGGTQTLGEIFGRGHALIDRLRSRIDEAVDSYIARMKDDPNHPLFRRRRRGFAYSGSWSARLHDCGYHTNHFHPEGWISSAFYVALPDVVDNEGEQQGWIKFGEPSFDTDLKDPVRRAVKPLIGRLVLFPSYMWHGTVPFQSTTARTTIAFDVVPN